MDAESQPSDTAPPKFSRYRSVRRAHALQHGNAEQPPTPALPTVPQAVPMPPPPPAEPPSSPAPEPSVSRSMSRYHRRPNTAHGAAAKAPPVRSQTVDVPPLPQPTPTTQSQSSSSARNRALSSPHNPAQRVANSAQPRVPNTSRSRAEAAQAAPRAIREPSQNARDEAKHLLQVEADRQRRMKEKIRAEQRAKQEAEQAEREKQEKLRKEEEEAARQKAQREAEEAEQLRRQKEEREREQEREREKEKEREKERERGKKLQKAEAARRLQQQEEEERRARLEEESRRAQKQQHSSPPVSPQRQGGGGMGLFRRRKDETPSSPESPVQNSRSRQTSGGERDLETIRPGGGGVVLGIDAPISAVNAGDRRVRVMRNGKPVRLPVTPTTTPLDLIKSAANIMTEPINVRTAVIQESFLKVSLTRPLRNYEHVRDVMNSWDDDGQNDLIIVDATTDDIDQDALLASQVPDSKPVGGGVYIHYSSKPGKWSKRWLLLRPDGQLVMAKNDKTKDVENICTLTDFDIYSPTQNKLKKIKPPKKYCYAVKSQQRSNIFADESRYVHFFCTNDKGTSDLFYRMLQLWRSWHLKHVMGEGQKKKAPPAQATGGFLPKVGGVASGPKAAAHSRNESVDSHYQLGSFQPLLDLAQFDREIKDEEVMKPGSFPDDAPLSRLNTRAMHSRKMSARAKHPPPVSYGLSASSNETTSQNSSRQNTLLGDGPDVFSSGGLLGRTYSQRQKAAQEREKQANNSGPFTDGPSLLNNMQFSSPSNDSGLNRRSSVRSTTHHRRSSSDIQRSLSTRHNMPKPLVDLTPQYRAPPQHARKGKGFNPEPSAAGGPLIENATSIEEAIKIPSSTDWRTRPSTSRAHGNAMGHERTRSLKGRGEGLANYTVNNHSAVPEDANMAFTGSGLLARAGFSQGHTPVGRGVMDGSKARGPMLDMREGSEFAAGSLLAGVERSHPSAGPVIDREK